MKVTELNNGLCQCCHFIVSSDPKEECKDISAPIKVVIEFILFTATACHNSKLSTVLYSFL